MTWKEKADTLNREQIFDAIKSVLKTNHPEKNEMLKYFFSRLSDLQEPIKEEEVPTRSAYEEFTYHNPF